ncbi:MAG: DUF5688 family protein [Lachnospiraceae bacterium]|nr:DUF5688 family protein [Lachnospiraceae bacterium]
MNFDEFKEQLRDGVCMRMGADVTVCLQETEKNNEVKRWGLMIRTKDCAVSPVFYLEEMYRRCSEGESTIEQLSGEIADTYLREMEDKKKLDVSFFKDYEKVRKGLVIKAVGSSRNPEILQIAPHKEQQNLSLLVYYLFQEGTMENGSILIRNEHLKLWNITKEQLFEDAEKASPKNLPGAILSMESMMEEMGHPFSWNEEEKKGAFDPMYILSNDRKLFGAAAMFYPGVLESFSERLGLSFYILPSSVHEVLLVPDYGQYRFSHYANNGADLLHMVVQINATEVPPEEVLADAVYYYDKNTRKMSILAEK